MATVIALTAISLVQVVRLQCDLLCTVEPTNPKTLFIVPPTAMRISVDRALTISTRLDISASEQLDFIQYTHSMSCKKLRIKLCYPQRLPGGTNFPLLLHDNIIGIGSNERSRSGKSHSTAIVVDTPDLPTPKPTKRQKLFASTPMSRSPLDWSSSTIRWETEWKLKTAREKLKKIRELLEELEEFLQ